MNPRFRFTLLAVASLLATASQAAEPSYPQRPLQVVVPFAPGGGLDLNARRFSQLLGQQIGQAVAVVNRDGAAGTIGMQQIARAPADGYTLAFSPAVPLTSEPHRIGNLPYQLNSFQPVCQVFDNIFGLVVHQQASAQTLAALLTQARRDPQALRYGTSGTGSIAHLGVADIEQTTGAAFTHIPYKGDGPMLQDLLAQRLDFGAMLASSATSHIRNGTLKLVAVYSAKRHPAFPEVTTLAEAGIPVEQASFGGLFAPAKTPAPVIQQLESACRQVVADPDYQQWAAQNNQVLDFQDSAGFTQRLARDNALKQSTLKRLHLSN